MAEFARWKEKNEALWKRVYDEILAPDLEAEWERRAKVDSKESRQNDNLQEPDVPAEEFRQLSDRFNELSKKYQDLTQKVKYLERKNAAVMQKNKDMKESVRAWQEYADRSSGKNKAKDEMKSKDEQLELSGTRSHKGTRPDAHLGLDVPASPGIFPSATDLGQSSPTPVNPLIQQDAEPHEWSTSPGMSPQPDDRSSQASITPNAMLQYGRTHSTHRDPNVPDQNFFPQDPRLRNERGAETNLYSLHQGSSQTTEDERGETGFRKLPKPDAFTDEDIPQFVSARSLKRKRGRPIKSEFGIYADQVLEGSLERPLRVKDEQLSSPPIGTFSLMRTETVDLDAPTPNVLRTPRHPRRKASSHSNTTGTLHHQRSNSAPFTQGIKGEDFGSEVGLCNIHVDLATQQAVAEELRACSEPSDPTLNKPDILQPLDTNILVETPTGNPKKRARRSKHLQEKRHDMLAESGETHPHSDGDKIRLPPHMARAQVNRRLPASEILQSHSENAQEAARPSHVTAMSKQVTAISSTSRSTIATPWRTRIHNKIPATRSTPRDKLNLDDRPVWTMGSPLQYSSTRRARVRPSKEQNRLRKRPLAELRISDFKPNPAYNQGYSYAFTETLRKRGDRMCVPGCTNLQCCGSTFRAFAEAQAPLPASQEEVLLEEYLGTAYNDVQMTQMSLEERMELVLQARTKQMADESGKHREAYSRRRTPPGFWRVDFPTTQEHQEDREQAKEQEKTIIQDRWLEAQRKDGRWLFQDE